MAAVHLDGARDRAGNQEQTGAGTCCPAKLTHMPGPYLYGRMMKTGSRKRADKLVRPAARGVPDTGYIVKLFVGQGHGLIRLANGREIFFHRADIEEGTSINDLNLGDQVAFERLDDVVSGARALHVAKRSVRP